MGRSDDHWIDIGRSDDHWIDMGRSDDHWIHMGRSEDHWIDIGRLDDHWIDTGRLDDHQTPRATHQYHWTKHIKNLFSKLTIRLNIIVCCYSWKPCFKERIVRKVQFRKVSTVETVIWVHYILTGVVHCGLQDFNMAHLFKGFGQRQLNCGSPQKFQDPVLPTCVNVLANSMRTVVVLRSS